MGLELTGTTQETARKRALNTAARRHRTIAKAQHERNQAIREAHRLGTTQTEIAQRLGLSHTGVQWILKRGDEHEAANQEAQR